MFKRWINSNILALSLGLAIIPTIAFTPALQAQEAKSSIAVLPLEIRGSVSADEAGLLGDRVRSLIVQSQSYRVIERQAIDKILKEQGFQLSQNCQSQDCAIELGKLLSVKELVTGSVSLLGNLVSLQLRVINTETGTISNEAFLDCECDLRTLMMAKLPNTVSQLLNQSLSAPAAVSEPVSTAPIRIQRPWLITANVGNINSTMLDIQFNFNQYFAVHGAAGMGFSQSNLVTFPESGFILEGGAKVYFNPHDLAGFADLSFSNNTFINALLGVEYRHEKGLTFVLATGAGFNIRTTQFGFVYPGNFSSFLPSGMLLKAGVGYAF
jgi:TolB-like protein